MTTMNTRTKGMILSNYVADQIVIKGLDPKARADGASGAGNREKADVCTSVTIFGQNLGIECKNQKNINHKNSWKQVKKLESLGCEPILAFKDFGESLEETKVIIYLDTLLELVKSCQSMKIKPQTISSAYTNPRKDRELAFVLTHLKASLNKAIKLLE